MNGHGRQQGPTHIRWDMCYKMHKCKAYYSWPHHKAAPMVYRFISDPKLELETTYSVLNTQTMVYSISQMSTHIAKHSVQSENRGMFRPHEIYGVHHYKTTAMLPLQKFNLAVYLIINQLPWFLHIWTKAWVGYSMFKPWSTWYAKHSVQCEDKRHVQNHMKFTVYTHYKTTAMVYRFISEPKLELEPTYSVLNTRSMVYLILQSIPFSVGNRSLFRLHEI